MTKIVSGLVMLISIKVSDVPHLKGKKNKKGDTTGLLETRASKGRITWIIRVNMVTWVVRLVRVIMMVSS